MGSGKDSMIFKGIKDETNNLECAICHSKGVSHLCGTKWVCEDCFGTNPLANSLTERNKWDTKSK